MHLVQGREMRIEATSKSDAVPLQGLAGWLLGVVARVTGWGERPVRRKQMRVVETLSIGAKKQLVLVSCGGERFLVGTGPESVQTIVRVCPEAGGAGADATGAKTPAKSFGDLR